MEKEGLTVLLSKAREGAVRADEEVRALSEKEAERQLLPSYSQGLFSHPGVECSLTALTSSMRLSRGLVPETAEIFHAWHLGRLCPLQARVPLPLLPGVLLGLLLRGPSLAEYISRIVGCTTIPFCK